MYLGTCFQHYLGTRFATLRTLRTASFWLPTVRAIARMLIPLSRNSRIHAYVALSILEGLPALTGSHPFASRHSVAADTQTRAPSTVKRKRPRLSGEKQRSGPVE